MPSQFEITHPLLPIVLKQIKGAPNQFCAIQGIWKIKTNAGSDNYKFHLESFSHLIKSPVEFIWEVASSTEKSPLTYRDDLGFFSPRVPLFLLLNPNSLEINPQLVISKIKWIYPWDINDFRSTDEYHLIIGKFIQISSRTERGLFYGLQTLSQLVRFTDNEIPFQTIHDAPKHGIRAINIDWMAPRLNPLFIQEILAIAGEYKINAIQIGGDEQYTPSKQFEIEFNKNYLSYGQILKSSLEKTGEKLEFLDFNPIGISKMLELGFFPVISYQIVWQACNYWEGRTCPEASFIPRFWRNFFFNVLSERPYHSLVHSKFPIAIANIFKLFDKFPKKGANSFFGAVFNNLDDIFRAQLQKLFQERQLLLEFFKSVSEKGPEQSIRHPGFWDTFLELLELTERISNISELYKQYREILENLSLSEPNQVFTKLSIDKLKEFGSFLDDLLRILNLLDDQVVSRDRWYLLSKKGDEKLNLFEIKTDVAVVENLSSALQGYLQYQSKFLLSLKEFQNLLR